MGYSQPSGWNTDENVTLARELFKSGMGAAAVAAKIGHGCTKNAIDGLAARRNWRGFRKNNSPKSVVKTVWEGSVIAPERREAGPDPLPPLSEISWGAIHPISWAGFDAD